MITNRTGEAVIFANYREVVCQVWQVMSSRHNHANFTKRKTLTALYQQLALLVKGGRWDSNPRHSEPQSDALTN